jgi:hypothetical protein
MPAAPGAISPAITAMQGVAWCGSGGGAGHVHVLSALIILPVARY